MMSWHPKRNYSDYLEDINYQATTDTALPSFTTLATPPDSIWALDASEYGVTPERDLEFVSQSRSQQGYHKTEFPKTHSNETRWEVFHSQASGEDQAPAHSSLENESCSSTLNTASGANDADTAATNKLICYGMIYLSKVQLVGHMQAIVNELKYLPTGLVPSHYLLDVVCQDNELLIKLPSGCKFARLNDQLKEALQELVAQQSVQLQALLHRSTILDHITKATSLKNSETLANLNVYGDYSTSHSTGVLLSKHKVWLQRPEWVPDGISYRNPHVIDFGIGETEERADVAHHVEAVDGDRDSFSADCLYSQLSRASHMHGMLGDFRLATSLLPHQQKSLEFMVQREEGDIPTQFRLWQPESDGTDTCYYHSITKLRSRVAQDEHGGGILADEMGMGKTLSALALITRTLDSAMAWSTRRDVHLSENISPIKTLSPATLVVVPSPLLLSSWQKEMSKRLKIPLKTFTYHGSARHIGRTNLANHDVVLTTYHTLIADHNKQDDTISNIAWYRIVLDEAHVIRRSSTLLHKRVVDLDAKFRWCVTGTPVQNTLEDVGSLLAFLGIAPFDRIGHFKKHICGKLTEGPRGIEQGHANLIKLMDAMCIRQTKDQVDLSPPDEKFRFLRFSPEEQEQYDSMKSDMLRAMSNIIGESDNKKRFGTFQAKLQLRLLCNHGTYQDHFHWAKNQTLLDGYREGFDNSSSLDWESTCFLCGEFDSLQLFEDRLADNSCPMHHLCLSCKTKSAGECPVCSLRSRSSDDDGMVEKWTRKALRQNGMSTKMTALVEDLRSCREDKSIVFSCWTTTLDLVARSLQLHGIPFQRVDGEQSFRHRQGVLDAFATDNGVSVLIMTTGVGAFGLDLMVANRVFLVEPQWNPSVEAQAIGRTTRIGQCKAVQVTRYIIMGTVEQEMQDLQQRKRDLARMAEGTQIMTKMEREYW